MRRKSVNQFIREHRNEIDEAVRRVLRDPQTRLNDEDRRQWIANDEGLYRWARREGANV